jgi:hypothetical protein
MNLAFWPLLDGMTPQPNHHALSARICYFVSEGKLVNRFEALIPCCWQRSTSRDEARIKTNLPLRAVRCGSARMPGYPTYRSSKAAFSSASIILPKAAFPMPCSAALMCEMVILSHPVSARSRSSKTSLMTAQTTRSFSSGGANVSHGCNPIAFLTKFKA